MGDFNWTLWRNKLLKKIGCIIVGALAQTAAHLQIEPVPTEYVWVTVFAVEAIEIVINAIKHKYLTE